MNLLSSLNDNSIDILVFNPPYVPTEDDEIFSSGIEASWAGGKRGRRIIDKFIPVVKVFIYFKNKYSYQLIIPINFTNRTS